MEIVLNMIENAFISTNGAMKIPAKILWLFLTVLVGLLVTFGGQIFHA